MPKKKKLLLDRYINLLKAGQIVAFPTETVYGLGADATNISAIKKVFKAKNRPADNPLIVHISSPEMLHQFAADIPEDAQKLIDAFWPGPLTLIFKKKPDVLDIITAGLSTVAVRWPGHPLSQDIIERVGPLVAPSANSSGKPSPTKPEHIKEDLGIHFPIVEAGKTQIGLESTVLDVSVSPFQLYRPGSIGRNQIENIIEKPVKVDRGKSGVNHPKSPGTKYSHYAPEARVQWLQKGTSLSSETTLYLLHRHPPEEPKENIVFFAEDYEEMAHQLYDRFRQADHDNYRYIFVESFSPALQKKEPLAEALHNRISKAIG
jgi:L-threonylcarbamoyladenylate synthase